MAQFDEVRFPTNIAFRSTGGPQRQSQIVITGSGGEARNARWRNSRRNYDIVYGALSNNDIHSAIVFFEARNAMLIGFRFKDWQDWKSCPPDNTPKPTDQQIGIGVGAISPTFDSFQLVKTYTSGPSSYVRNIRKPVTGTVLIALDGVKQNSGFSINATGLVTFSSPPGSGVIVTAGYEFDVPVRFNTDELKIDSDNHGAATISSLPIMELPDQEFVSA